MFEYEHEIWLMKHSRSCVDFKCIPSMYRDFRESKPLFLIKCAINCAVTIPFTAFALAANPVADVVAICVAFHTLCNTWCYNLLYGCGKMHTMTDVVEFKSFLRERITGQPPEQALQRDVKEGLLFILGKLSAPEDVTRFAHDYFERPITRDRLKQLAETFSPLLGPRVPEALQPDVVPVPPMMPPPPQYRDAFVVPQVSVVAAQPGMSSRQIGFQL